MVSCLDVGVGVDGTHICSLALPQAKSYVTVMNLGGPLRLLAPGDELYDDVQSASPRLTFEVPKKGYDYNPPKDHLRRIECYERLVDIERVYIVEPPETGAQVRIFRR